MKNLILAIAPLMTIVLLVWFLARVIVSPADAGRPARQIDGEVEFAPNKRSIVATPVFVGFLVYLGVTMFLSHLPSFVGIFGAGFWLLLAALILTTFPATLFANEEGLKQRFWLGKTRFVAWKDVSQVVYDENKHRLTIRGKGRTKVVHTRQLPDRSRLIEELEKHCEDKVPEGLRKTAVSVA